MLFLAAFYIIKFSSLDPVCMDMCIQNVYYEIMDKMNVYHITLPFKLILLPKKKNTHKKEERQTNYDILV